MTGLDAATRKRLRDRAQAYKARRDVEARLIAVDPRELLALLDAADRVALLQDVADAARALGFQIPPSNCRCAECRVARALARLADHDQETSQ